MCREKKEEKAQKLLPLGAGQETIQSTVSSTSTVKLEKGMDTLAKTSSRQIPWGEGTEILRKPHPKGTATLGPLKIKAGLENGESFLHPSPD